jgi:hypothetical protein
VEQCVALFVVYAVGIAATVWYTLTYLPFPDFGQISGFVLNIIESGLLSLLSFRVYRQEQHFRSVFFQFWLIFAALALSGPVVYGIQAQYGGWAAMIAYEISIIAIHVLFLWVMVKILFAYVFHDEKRWAINVLSSVVVFPLCLWLFWPYYWRPEILMSLPTAKDAVEFYHPVLKPAIVVNIVSLLMLLAFFLHKLRTDRPIGVFADTLIFLFGLSCLFDTIEILAQVNSLELMNLTQWAMGIINLAMMVTLVLRLKYKTQTIAHYYESQCISFDPRVGRRVGLFDRLILWCFFDQKAVGERVFLGAGRQKMMVKRTSPRVNVPQAKS